MHVGAAATLTLANSKDVDGTVIVVSIVTRLRAGESWFDSS